jgi:RHS repeat-associated protein
MRSWIDNSNASHSENFAYDVLNRLQTVTGPMDKSTQFDAVGDLASKSDVGNFVMLPSSHQLASVAGSPNVTYGFDVDGNEISDTNGFSASWMSFNKPSSLTRSGVTDSFLYGPEKQLVQQIAGSLTTIYVSPDFKVIFNSSTGVAEIHETISSPGRPVAMLIDRTDGSSSWQYLQQDHLGSTEVATDASGNLLERLSYDAWGRRRNVDGTDATGSITSTDSVGYTGQEELDNVALIYMQGRVYDPMLARFISADPFGIDLGDPQSENRYAYVRGRPLSSTDPTGYEEQTLPPVTVTCGVIACGPSGSTVAMPFYQGYFTPNFPLCGSQCQMFERLMAEKPRAKVQKEKDKKKCEAPAGAQIWQIALGFGGVASMPTGLHGTSAASSFTTSLGYSTVVDQGWIAALGNFQMVGTLQITGMTGTGSILAWGPQVSGGTVAEQIPEGLDYSSSWHGELDIAASKGSGSVAVDVDPDTRSPTGVAGMVRAGGGEGFFIGGGRAANFTLASPTVANLGATINGTDCTQ